MYVPDATSLKQPRVALVVGVGQRGRHPPDLADSMLDQTSEDAYLGRLPVVGYWTGDERDTVWEQDSRVRWRPSRFHQQHRTGDPGRVRCRSSGYGTGWRSRRTVGPGSQGNTYLSQPPFPSSQSSYFCPLGMVAPSSDFAPFLPPSAW
jgi:hypothetical protein